MGVLASMSAVQDEADEGPDIAAGHLTTESQTNENGEHNDFEEDGTSDLPREDAEERNVSKELANNGSKRGNERLEEANHAALTSSFVKKYAGLERASSADGSLSLPDDTLSAQDSLMSSPGRGGRLSNYSQSPTPSVRPFDRRFQARKITPSLNAPRTTSPAFLNVHSRQSSTTYTAPDPSDEEVETPWEVIRWAKLRKMTGQAFSEVGKRQFGRPTCIAVSASIALGTSKGLILVFDYNQNLKSIIGQGTKATEVGAVTSISISADHSTVAGGHATGHIFTWELSKPAKPFLHIAPTDKARRPGSDGHVQDAAILHVGFLGIRHTALASADDTGMAFSHLATRGMGAVARSVNTTRVLGRYPEKSSSETRQKKPSSVLAFSTLPLGNAEHTADTMGLVAMLTPYLLVVVSTMPIAQTQFKAPRSKDVIPHGTMTAALAWFPSVRLKTSGSTKTDSYSRTKLVYCWSNILSVLDILEVEALDSNAKSDTPTLQFRPRNKWKAPEAIVAVQWLSRSVLAVLTITQQLVILEDSSMIVTDSSDLMPKHIYHRDLFSQQLDHLVDQLEDEENAAMHGVVADAFYMSFRAYKGRLFLLGYSDVSFGTLSNWADRLMALVDDGNYIGAIQLSTEYFTGQADKVTVGLPEDDHSRHEIVQEKVIEMILASLNYAFGKEQDTSRSEESHGQLKQLASACITACVSIGETDFLFDEVFVFYENGGFEGIFLEEIEAHIVDDEITTIPPAVLKSLVEHFTTSKFHVRLEELICHLDPRTMDIDQITNLCKKNELYDALLYVWNQGLKDYTTILNQMLTLDREAQMNSSYEAFINKIFSYLSYILTGRVYPTGKEMPDDDSKIAKAELYAYFFPGTNIEKFSNSPLQQNSSNTSSFLNLRKILDLDAPSFFSMLNEAFEDGFLNGPQERMSNESPGQLTDQQRFGLSVNRQWIVSILLNVVKPDHFDSEAIVFLDMFIARNLPKFPQFILLPDRVLHRVLVGLCENSDEDIREDCELSVEYLLSMYQPPDLHSLIPMIHQARFFRVLKSIYRTERQYANLLQISFEDHDNPEATFDCIRDCLDKKTGLNARQTAEVRSVLVEHARELLIIDVRKTASTIERYAPDLHDDFVQSLDNDDLARYQYLNVVLEPHGQVEESQPHNARLKYVEQYVELLCEYNSSHVRAYVETLRPGDLRLEEVLPALEEGGAVDAAVILMAREGKADDGIRRLNQHLQTLEKALLGLVEGSDDSPDVGNTIEAGQDLMTSIQKYARVGIWLCRGQTKVAQRGGGAGQSTNLVKAMRDALTADEELWSELIDTIVTITKNVTEVLEQLIRAPQRGAESGETPSRVGLDKSKMITDLRSVVQETFTALLNATTPPRTSDTKRTDVSFLRILRAFLTRATLSSPSLSNLRGVLSAIFSAYAHEESLLSLSNRLLDKDLFVHVTEADQLRRRGWRPLGQVCEGCGRRVWGPGAGGYIWDAWQQDNKRRGEEKESHFASRSPSTDSRLSKGKAVRRDGKTIAISASPDDRPVEDVEGNAVVIFACRHMFHRTCLETMGGTRRGGEQGRELLCPLEA